MNRPSIKIRPLTVLKLTLPVLALLLIQASVNAQTFTEKEQACFSAVQGKVAWNKAGNTKWVPSNVRRLCAGVQDIEFVIKCYEDVIREADDLKDAIDRCSENLVEMTPETEASMIAEDKKAIDAARAAKIAEEKKRSDAAKASMIAEDKALSDAALAAQKPAAPAATLAIVSPPPVAPPAVETRVIAKSPLSPADLNSVMTWISVQVGATRLPYCYKQSYGRGIGEPISSCAPGLEKDAALCYQACRAGFTGAAFMCWAECPAGFTRFGALCQKPNTWYGRAPEGYPWKFGDGFNLDGAIARCESDKGRGNCEKVAAIIYPKCLPGFHPDPGGLICTPNCPSGWTDTLSGCARPNYTRDVGKPLTCRPGLEQGLAMCYEPCKEGHTGVGPVCWQQCPRHLPVGCAAGCAKSAEECALVTVDMVISPVMMAASIASLGSASGATAGVNAATKTATAAARGGAGVAKLKGIFTNIKNASTAAKGSVEKFVGGAENLKALQTAAEAGTTTFDAGNTIADQIELFRNEFADNFATMTSPEIEQEIDRRFSPKAAYEIKRQWGLRHLALMMEDDGVATFKNYLSLLSIADPTGVTAVVNAFFHTQCKSDTPFPDVKALY